MMTPIWICLAIAGFTIAVTINRCGTAILGAGEALNRGDHGSGACHRATNRGEVSDVAFDDLYACAGEVGGPAVIAREHANVLASLPQQGDHLGSEPTGATRNGDHRWLPAAAGGAGSTPT